MANQGGPNEIGKVSVGVEANIMPLLEGLERAKVQATQAASEIQSRLNPLGYDTSTGKTGPTGAAASAYGYGTTPSQMAETTRQTDNQTRATRDLGDSVRNAAGAVGLLVGEWERYAQIGQSIGNMMSDGTRQALELRDAINESNRALERSIQLREEAYSARVGGNANVGSYASNKVSELDRIIQTDQESIAGNGAFLSHLGQKVLAGVLNVFSGGEMSHMSTSYEQTQTRIKENQARRDALAREADAIRNREESQFTVGGIAASLSGLPPGSLPPIQRLSPSGAAMTRDFYSNNPDLLDMLVKYHQMSYMQREQQIIEAMRGNREVNYR